jgi:hypothetical protein
MDSCMNFGYVRRIITAETKNSKSSLGIKGLYVEYELRGGLGKRSINVYLSP